MDTSPESSDSFPLKSFISEKSGGGGSSAQPVADSEAGAGKEEAINPEKLAYILIGVRHGSITHTLAHCLQHI